MRLVPDGQLNPCFGSTMKAGDLFRVIFERIPTTKEICGRENAMPSVWWVLRDEGATLAACPEGIQRQPERIRRG